MLIVNIFAVHFNVLSILFYIWDVTNFGFLLERFIRMEAFMEVIIYIHFLNPSLSPTPQHSNLFLFSLYVHAADHRTTVHSCIGKIVMINRRVSKGVHEMRYDSVNKCFSLSVI